MSEEQHNTRAATLDRQRLGTPPPNYKEALYWEIKGKGGRLITMNLLAVPLFAFFGICFFAFAFAFGAASSFATLYSEWSFTTIAGMVITLALHEFVHGIAMRFFGARPQYGISILMLYTTSPGYAFRRNQYLVVALAPLIVLSASACIGIIIMAGSPWVLILALLASINAAGAVGDLWISAVVLRYPSDAYVVDERDGIRILLPYNEINA